MNLITETRHLINDFHKNQSSAIEVLRKHATVLTKASRQIERSWSGSYAGWHGQMYFMDFQIPDVDQRFSEEWGGINGIPDGWQEQQPEEVIAKIDEIVGDEFSTETFEKLTNEFRKTIEQFRDKIVLALSIVQFTSAMEREEELFRQIEKVDVNSFKSTYIKNNLPGTLMSRDTEALRQGTCVPVWLYYSGLAWEAEQLCDTAEELQKLTQRLMRQLEVKLPLDSPAKLAANIGRLATLHPKIQTKCKDLYEKEAYAEAAEKGFKVVRDRLRELSGYETGSETFGKGKLHIKGAAAQNVDKDFNEAVKFLTMSIDRFRNEKSHTSDGNIDDPVRAYEYLCLSSLAMYLLDDAEIVP